MSPSYALFAPAKVNLFLHVLARRPDGYHELESLIVFVDVGDQLVLEPARQGDLDVRIEGPFAGLLADEPVSDNLVSRAARDLLARSRRAHAAADASAPGAGLLRLHKNLPVAAGLGGGSADAAAALRLFRHAWDLEIAETDLHALATALGADIPVCVEARPALVTGIGEDIAPAPALPDLWCLLVNSGTPVPTGRVFKGLDPDRLAGRPGPDVPQADYADAERFLAALAHTRNDLEVSALTVAPDIADVLALIAAQPGCGLARMSGSGGTCFGLFTSEATAQAAAQAIRTAQPGWWVAAGRVLDKAPALEEIAPGAGREAGAR